MLFCILINLRNKKGHRIKTSGVFNQVYLYKEES